MDILPVILFILGVGFLFLGWRWQNPPHEEALTALKGLAYMKREMIRVEDQVHSLERKLLVLEEIDLHKTEHGNVQPMEKETKELNFSQSEPPQKCSLYLLNANNKRQGSANVEVSPRLSPKYQEVLKLAANGQCIPEIAQRLVLSQDAVRMVLRMQPDGGNNR